jgi:hypothetical protein
MLKSILGVQFDASEQAWTQSQSEEARWDEESEETTINRLSREDDIQKLQQENTRQIERCKRNIRELEGKCETFRGDPSDAATRQQLYKLEEDIRSERARMARIIRTVNERIRHVALTRRAFPGRAE